MSNRCKTAPKIYMGVPSPDMDTSKRTDQVFFKFVSPVLNMGFMGKMFRLTANQNKSL